GAGHVGQDSALVVLRRLLDALLLIKEHGVADGPWEWHIQWVNDQIAKTWQARGAFPGLGAALEAFGIRHGTALAYDLMSEGIIGIHDDPSPVVDALMRGGLPPPRTAYAGDINALGSSWPPVVEDLRH